MSLHLYQVDAFTDSLFGGNPAAVGPLNAWLPDDTMCAIAAENNLSETAFFIPAEDDNAADFHLLQYNVCSSQTLTQKKKN